jgi:hypothetical protein
MKRVSQLFQDFKNTDMLEVSVPIEWFDLLYINRFQLIPIGDFYQCLRLKI